MPNAKTSRRESRLASPDLESFLFLLETCQGRRRSVGEALHFREVEGPEPRRRAAAGRRREGRDGRVREQHAAPEAQRFLGC